MKKGILAILVLALCSCGILKHRAPTIQRDTIYIAKTDVQTQKDSIYVYKDRIVKEKGDTVYIKEYLYKYRDRWRDREVHDTLYREKIKTETKEVEKRLTKSQNFFLNFGKTMLLLVLLLLGYGIYRIIKKFKLI